MIWESEVAGQALGSAAWDNRALELAVWDGQELELAAWDDRAMELAVWDNRALESAAWDGRALESAAWDDQALVLAAWDGQALVLAVWVSTDFAGRALHQCRRSANQLQSLGRLWCRLVHGPSRGLVRGWLGAGRHGGPPPGVPWGRG